MVERKAAKVPFINTFLSRVLAENLKGGKLETDVQAPGIEQLCRRIHRSTFINVSSRTLSTRERASGRFPSRERAATLVRSQRSAAREPHGAQRKKRRIGRERRGMVARREKETRDALRDGWDAGVRNRREIGTHGWKGERWDTRGGYSTAGE